MSFSEMPYWLKGMILSVLGWIIYSLITIVRNIQYDPIEEVALNTIFYGMPFIIIIVFLGFLMDSIFAKREMSLALKLGFFSLFVPVSLMLFLYLVEEGMGLLFMIPILLGTIPLFIVGVIVGAIITNSNYRWGNFGLMLGLVSLSLFVVPYIGIIFSIIAVAFCLIQRRYEPSKAAIWGIIIGILGIALNGVSLVFRFRPPM